MMSNTADRRRKLTEKGQTMFEEQCEKLKGGMDKAWKEVEDVLINSGLCGKDFKKVREVERELNMKFKNLWARLTKNFLNDSDDEAANRYRILRRNIFILMILITIIPLIIML